MISQNLSVSVFTVKLVLVDVPSTHGFLKGIYGSICAYVFSTLCSAVLQFCSLKWAMMRIFTPWKSSSAPCLSFFYLGNKLLNIDQHAATVVRAKVHLICLASFLFSFLSKTRPLSLSKDTGYGVCYSSLSKCLMEEKQKNCV